jgi:hypothetical protein
MFSLHNLFYTRASLMSHRSLSYSSILRCAKLADDNLSKLNGRFLQ